MANKLVLAKLETDELVIGEFDSIMLKKCLLVDYIVDEEDDCSYNVRFSPVFDYLSEDLIEIDADLIMYKTENIKPDIVDQYKSVVASILKHNKIKNTLIDINKNVKDRKNHEKRNSNL